MAALFIGLSACGTGAPSKSPARDEKAAAQKEAQQQARAEQLALKKRQFQQCSSVSQQLDTKLNDLNSRLEVGLPFTDYSKSVGDLRVAYDRMFKQLGKTAPEQAPCLTKVLVPLEAAMNSYASAYNVWNDCINDYNCSMEGDTLAKAQKSWAKAGRQITRGERGLRSMQPAG